MDNSWNKMDKAQEPTMEMVSGFVQSPLWDDLCQHIETQYKVKPVFSYSGCKMEGDWDGWNVKYKKSGRSLCSLYPQQGSFIALVVIGGRERAETEYALPFLSPYLQRLYQDTKEGMGQKWLAIEVTEKAILDDLKKLIAIRKNAPPLQ